jgi:hypothetical protein
MEGRVIGHNFERGPGYPSKLGLICFMEFKWKSDGKYSHAETRNVHGDHVFCSIEI